MSTDLFGNLDEPESPATIGSLSSADTSSAPLAVRMRPRKLDDIVGQDHLLGDNAPLRRLAQGQPMSVFLWGPPGVGKTTIASVVSKAAKQRFVELSAVTAGVRDVRSAIETAKRELAYGRPTVLFIDEVHRFSKSQQDVLLPAVENRLVTLIAATTENPSFSVISPLLSRSLLLRLRSLEDGDISSLLTRALNDERGLAGAYELDDLARDMIVRLSGGDARRALTYLEESSAGCDAIITTDVVSLAIDNATIRYDRDGDQHYDVISAFIKSIRGSDVNAALHYLARMLEAGEDPRFIARRLIISASEDIGMASPQVLSTVVSAASAVALIGMPEARLTLAHATVAAATAPKSNAVYLAIDEAIADVRAGRIGDVPAHLRDGHYAMARELGHGVGYAYPHDFEHGVVAQQYLPDALVGRTYFTPTRHGAEAALADRLEVLDSLLAPTKRDEPGR